MASYLNELLGAESVQPTTAGPTRTLKREQSLGLIGGLFDLLGRPGRAISETVGAARAGEDDLLSAAWRGLSGDYRYETLGYQAFPEAKEKGFQPLDIAAFAVDVLADPLTWAGPGIAKAAGKPLAKGALALGGKFGPKITKILPEIEKGLTPAQNRKMLYEEMKALGWGKGGHEALMKRMEIAAPRQEIKDLFKMVRAGKYTKLRKSGRSGAAIEEVVKGRKDTAFRNMLRNNPWLVDEMRQQMRFMDANENIAANTALASLGRSLGTGLMPIVKSLNRFAGKPGKKIADGLDRAMTITRNELEPYYGRLAKAFDGLTDDEVVQSVRLREMGEVMRPMVTEKAAKAADEWGAALDEIRKSLVNFRDPLGNELRVWNPMRGRIGRWEPFKDHIQPGYYPWVWPKEVYTKAGQKDLFKKLVDSGMSIDEANGLVTRLAHRPKRVGHIEMVRVGNGAGRELDARKVLPKYFYDVLLRKNLAHEFGVNNEILDVALGDLNRAGFTKKYIDSIKQVVTGKNIHDETWEKLATYITSFQALSKLGFATSGANAGQGPMNQWIRSGLPNTLQSIAKRVAGEKPDLGAAAFMRASRGDIVKGMLGGKSKFTDWYMKWIGFDATERFGRYIGALGGDLEAQTMARRWFENVGRAATGNKKALKEAGRLESELMRKYKIPVSVIDDAGKIPEVIEIAGRPRRLLDEAAIMAADKTMHAFFPWELPPGWRSPFWRTALQFKSFIYKQSEFMMNEVLGPGIQWLATDGAKGDAMPMLRTLFSMPIGAEAVTHLRDVLKSAPEHIQSLAREGKFSDREFKEFFWEADKPINRVLSDLTYVGTFGLLGDAIDSAVEGRLWKWGVGPTIADVIEGIESIPQGKVGQFATRQLPGALGLPYSADAVEWVQQNMNQRKLR